MAKRRYLKKETAAHRFRWEFLKKWDGKLLTEALKRDLWELYLLQLCDGKLITDHQARTWTYPEAELKH